jgi:hypothetical protein
MGKVGVLMQGWELPPEMRDNAVANLPLLFPPFLDNIFIHGVEHLGMKLYVKSL